MTTEFAEVGLTRSSEKGRGAWLFSRRLDLTVFLVSAVLSLVALAVGRAAGVLDAETPGWAWVPAVVLCDVAHVWATLVRTYLNQHERQTRPLLLTAVPILAFALGLGLYRLGDAVFWRALAYIAIFHFVRQQYGWVALYRSRAGEHGRVGRAIDTAAIYASTLYPLLYWHTHLPRAFAWFVAGDIVALPSYAMPFAQAAYVLALGAYVARACADALRGRPQNVGKHVVVGTTAVMWNVGIVVCNSDYAFTVTNVFIHGIPYFALVYIHAVQQAKSQTARPATLLRNPWTYVAFLWTLAFAEEFFWDRGVWQERAWLFGEPWDAQALRGILVPLLAVPALTHYVLDGFLWRKGAFRLERCDALPQGERDCVNVG